MPGIKTGGPETEPRYVRRLVELAEVLVRNAERCGYRLPPSEAAAMAGWAKGALTLRAKARKGGGS